MNAETKNSKKTLYGLAIELDTGIARLYDRKDESVELEVGLSVNSGTKYEKVGALRYITQCIRTVAHALVDEGRTVADALAVAGKQVLDAMDAGTYTVNTGVAGESVSSTSAEQEYKALMDVFLPRSAYTADTKAAYAAMITDRFLATKIITKTRTTNGVATTFETTQRPLFKELCKVPEIKTFLDEYFNVTPAAPISLDALLSKPLPSATM